MKYKKGVRSWHAFFVASEAGRKSRRQQSKEARAAEGSKGQQNGCKTKEEKGSRRNGTKQKPAIKKLAFVKMFEI